MNYPEYPEVNYTDTTPTLTRMEWYAGLAMHALLSNESRMKKAEELADEMNSGYADELEVVAIDAVLAAKRLIEQLDGKP